MLVPEGVHRVDVRDAAEWADLLDGVDAVCHQAAMVGAGVTVADLPLYAGHNDLGTAALLAAMHERGVDALVLASSMVVYGEGRYSCAENRARSCAAAAWTWCGPSSAWPCEPARRNRTSAPWRR